MSQHSIAGTNYPSFIKWARVPGPCNNQTPSTMLTPALEFPHSIRYSSLGDDSIATSYNLSESYKYKSLKVRLYRGLGIYEDRAPNRGLHKVIQRLVIPPPRSKGRLYSLWSPGSIFRYDPRSVILSGVPFKNSVLISSGQVS